MPTTTATTGPPANIADAVRTRLGELADRGKWEFTAADFTDVAARANRPQAWVVDHLHVLEGIGVLRGVRRPGPRTWALAPGTEYLR